MALAMVGKSSGEGYILNLGSERVGASPAPATIDF